MSRAVSPVGDGQDTGSLHCSEVLQTSLCFSIPAIPDLGIRVEASPCPWKKAHHHPVCHEQDQSGRDVDGKERARGSPEVLSLAAAKQVLLP